MALLDGLLVGNGTKLQAEGVAGAAIGGVQERNGLGIWRG